jgi:predicted ATPase/class 3 adenylate cyclase
VSQPVQIPSGTITLLFTDVEGSTKLWETEPDYMAQALRRHDEILRAAVEEAGGFVFKTVGDAFCAAFSTPQAALDAVLDAQQAIVTQRWPTRRPVRVRMGMHTGVCEERDNDYFGPVVNRTARLEAIAYGGQVLVSGVTAGLLSETLPGGVTLRDLGPHRLKDLGRPEQVWQLEAEFLDPSFPPLGSLDNPELPNNLPGQPSAFIGREREVDEVRSLLGSSRLVTLTGSGGSGKTRLALQAAADLLEGASDGVWLAELASLTDGEQIPRAVAAVLGLSDRAGHSLLDSVTEALASQDTLILLDNCEHVIDAAAKFCDQVIRHCPRVRILATSREPLGIDGERVYRVPSLSLPPGDVEVVEDLAACDAVALFVDRARVQDSAFTLDDSVAPIVGTICRRLDGIPLALELAAARLSSMSLKHLSERLDQRFRLLTGGSRNAMPRQQTLQAAVDWSFGLLSPAEREALTRLSVFVGGFEMEAAEAICTTDGVDALDVMDLLGSLVGKSLVVADRTPESVRYRLLETIRQYSSQELLRAAGEAEVLRARDRHADFYLRIAEAAAPALTGPGQREWLRRLDLEWDNLHAAFAHLAADERTDDVLRLGVALQRFAYSRAHAGVLSYLQPAVEQADPAPGELLAKALVATSWLINVLARTNAGRLAAAKQFAERGLTMARQLGRRPLEAQALGSLIQVAYFERDLASVQRLGDEAVAIAREIGDVQLTGELLRYLAAPLSGDEARRIRLEALACFRQTGDELLAASELHMLYGLDIHEGLIEDARAHLEQAIALAERLGDKTSLYFFRTDLCILLLIEGKHAEAAPMVRRCLLVARRLSVRLEVCEVLLAAACCAAWQGDQRRAARLHGAADADISVAIDSGMINWSDVEQNLRDQEKGRLRELMGDGPFDDAYRSGAKLALEQAVELALGREVPD